MCSHKKAQTVISDSASRSIGLLFPPQQELLDAGFRNSVDDWVISTPTGSGKTLIAEWAIDDTLRRGLSAIYLAPLRAIVDEKAAEWQFKYGHEAVGVFTGETARRTSLQNPALQRVLLMTPEKLISYLLSWRRHQNWLSRVGLIVVDELHLLGDSTRGAGLESMVVRFRRVNPFIRFIGLSGTLSNAEQLAAWIGARTFVSDWRPIPVEKHIRRFKNLNHKYGLLLEDIRATLTDHGKVLVFVNSRKKAESLTARLRDDAVASEFHHAGLPRDDKLKIQSSLRDRKIDVMISTSALEMGVNFPVRKVIIYDAYCFDGESFAPMSIQRFQQCAGRAGRPGYDATGEACIFLPSWDSAKINYIRGQAEPIESALFRRDALLREILGEISSRLCISGEHLETNFAARTLWRRQGGQLQLDEHLKVLKDNALIKETEKEKRTYLADTPLGRIATQMALSPSTIILWACVYKKWEWLEEFDFLLAVCLAAEASPVLGFNFEEIDHMGDQLLETPSTILDMTWDECRDGIQGLNPKRLLSAIKAAIIFRQYIDGQSLESLSDRYDCYTSDLIALKQNFVWLLAAAQRTFHVLELPRLREEFGDDDETPLPMSWAVKSCRDLGLMVEYGVPRESVGLVQIPGIGKKRAAALLAKGICRLDDLLTRSPDEVALILAVKPATAEKILDQARELHEQDKDDCPFGDQFSSRSRLQQQPKAWNWPATVDPYRLRRSFELRITHRSDECVRIEGGSEPHQVRVDIDALRHRSYTCDCHDFAKGHTLCKHIIRARLELNDDKEILEAIRMLQEQRGRSLRYGLGELWMRVSDLFDRFSGRDADYLGAQFLRKATLPHR